MEGLRSPRIGTPFPQPAPQVNPGRAAAALAAAAVIGAGGGSALADKGLTFENGYTPQSQPTRTAPIPSTNATNPAFQGLSGSRAPTMGAGALPSVGRAVAGGAAPPPSLRGAGAAGLAGALVPLAAAAALGLGKGLSPLEALKGALPISPFSKEAKKQNEEAGRQAEANREGIGKALEGAGKAVGDAFKNLDPRRAAERDKNNRKGDKKVSPIPNDGSKPLTGSQIGVQYEIQYLIFGVTPNVVYAYAPYGGVQKGVNPANGGDEWFLTDGRGVKRQLQSTVLSNAPPPTITGQRPLNGVPDPIPAYTPQNPNERSVGLNPGLSLGGSPILPSLPTNGASPSNPASSPSSPANKLPGTGAPTPSQGARPANNPSTPPAGEPTKPGNSGDSPSVPLLPIPPIQGNTPGQGTQTIKQPLGGIPSAPSTGSGTVGITLFPPAFNQQPGSRNTDAQKPLTPEAPKPTQTPEVASKCCTDTAEGLAEIKKVLGVGEFPAQLPILTGDEIRTINNIPELLLWNTSNTDAVSGLFPATVKAVQPDGTEKEFKLQNTAHAFEELFAAVLTMAEDADAAVNIGARIATEVVQTKIAVHQGNELLKAMQKFLGFAVRPMARIIKLNFSPTAAGLDGKLQNDEMAGFLKPSAQSYVGTELNEKHEALPMLQRILSNTEIAMRAVWHPIKPSPKGKDDITGSRLREKRGKPTAAEKKQWEEYIKILKTAGFEVEDNSPGKSK